MHTMLSLQDKQASSLFAFIAALTCVTALVLSTGGEKLEYLKTIQVSLGFTALILFTPTLAQALLEKAKTNSKFALISSEPVLLTLVFCLCVLTGKFLPADTNLAALISPLGYLVLISNLLLTRVHVKSLLPAAACATLFGIWLSGAAFADKHHSCLFLEKIAYGETSMDTLFHAGMANILVTYDKFSIGIDGNIFTQYHSGSHWIYAQLCKLLGLKAIYFYLVGFYCITVPLVLKALLMLVQLIASNPHSGLNWNGETKPLSNLYIPLFSLGACGIVPLLISKKLGIWTDIFFGESYGISLCLALLYGAIALTTYRAIENNYNGSPIESLLVIALSTIMVSLSFLCKFPIGAIALLLSGYLILRVKAWKNPLIMIGYIAGGIMSTVFYLQFRFPYQFKFEPFAFYQNFIGIPLLVPHLALYLFWFWLFLYLNKDIREDSMKKIKSGTTICLEVLSLAVLIGLIAVCSLNLAGGSIIFFYDPQYWLGLVFVCAMVAGGKIKAPSIQSNRSKIVIASIWLLLITNSAMAAVKLYQYQKSESVKLAELAVSRLKERTLLKQLKNLGDMDIKDKRQLAIFIPQNCKTFWSMVPPLSAPFLIPALTGIASIDGLPPYGTEGTLYYGYANFGYGARQTRVQNTTPEWICLLARSKGFKKLLWFSDDGERIDTWDCLKVCKIEKQM